MNHEEMKFEKKYGRTYLIFHLHISNIPNMYMYKKLHHIKGRDVELGVFRLPHSDLLEEQSYRGDTHGGPAIDFLHIDKLLAKRK